MRAGGRKRRLAGAVGTAVVAVGVLVGPATPAYAVAEAHRYDRVTGHNDQQLKTKSVECPDGESLIGTGAQVEGGLGGVVLTGIEPDVTQHAVTATARAAAAYHGDWSLRVYAVCGVVLAQPYLKKATNIDGRTAIAECDPGDRLVGMGFRLNDGAGPAYVDEVAPDPDGTRVRVREGGAASPVGVMAIGVCYRAPASVHRFDGPTDVAGRWSVPATVEDVAAPPVFVWGTGAEVSAAGYFIDALVPDPEHNRAGVHAVRAGGPPPASLARMAAGADGDGDSDSVTAYALGATFH